MENSKRLTLPYIMPQQAQKHVTHNEAIRKLDAIVQMSALSKKVTSPPEMPLEGQGYIIPELATGVWADKVNLFAIYQDGIWSYITPDEGWSCWVEEDQQRYDFSTGSWLISSSEAPNGDQLGINTTADSVNRLAVKSDTVLFSHDDVTPGNGDVRVVLNKNQENATSSMVFQSNYSARGELGLLGNDNLAFKVSVDANNWKNAMSIDASSGHLCMGNLNDFSANLTIAGDEPLLRVSNTSESEASIELVNQDNKDTEFFQLAYDCEDNKSYLRHDGATSMKIDSTKVEVLENFESEKTIIGEYLYSKSRCFIANNYTGSPNAEHTDFTEATNLDHIWNDESTNAWHFCSDTTYKATANATVRAAAFTTTSDYRLKQNITAIEQSDAVVKILALKPVAFNWAKDAGISSTKKTQGFIAHEVQTIIPEAVYGEKDEMQNDGCTPSYQSINSEKLLPILVSALQNAINRIIKLESMAN